MSVAPLLHSSSLFFLQSSLLSPSLPFKILCTWVPPSHTVPVLTLLLFFLHGAFPVLPLSLTPPSYSSQSTSAAHSLCPPDRTLPRSPFFVCLSLCACVRARASAWAGLLPKLASGGGPGRCPLTYRVRLRECVHDRMGQHCPHAARIIHFLRDLRAVCVTHTHHTPYLPLVKGEIVTTYVSEKKT